MTYGFSIDVGGDAVVMMKKIEAALATVGVEAKVQAHKVESSFAGMGEKVGGMFGNLKSMIMGGLGISAAFAGFEFIKSSKEAFDTLEESVAKVNAVLDSTKGIGGRTFEELEAGAKSLSKQTLFGRGAIMDGQSMLLTFTAIRGEIFDKTIPAVADFATRFKMDLPEAANMLGKALNDPLKGMTKLQRQGVVFSDSQKQTIENFVKTGQVAKAQSVILGELKTEFGGLATAMTQTDEGKVAMAKKQWGSIKLTIGEIVSKLEVAFIPLVGIITKIISSTIGFFKSSSTEATIFKDVLLAVGAAFAIYYTYLALVATWTKIVTAATWAWNAAMSANVITWVIVAVVALVAVLMVCWDKFKGFREFMGGLWGGIKEGIMTIVHAFMNLGEIIQDVITGNLSKALTDGKKMITDFHKDLTTGMTSAIHKGADAAGKSEFKFGNLMKFGGEGPSKQFGGGGAGGGRNGLKDNAINTSNLAGAKGGLGESKIINIRIDTMQKIITSDNRDLRSKAESAVEALLRTVNNIAYSQSSSQ